ncbi:hypothetical protein [Lentibacillus saliphilus]|uniref:hypothetical protein n=1 Tax=Lentibacillus saliphilus TaxID=2737028 RepID=UPI001C2F372E|nr:hypothetical protein [Lentibacillus saliphilus]
MIQDLKKRLVKEDGNTMLFVMGALGLLMILFVFVFNMGAAFVTKEQSASTARQASLAATSAFYDELRHALSGEEIKYGESDENDSVDEEDSGEGESSEETWNFDEELQKARESTPIGSLSPNEWEIEILERVITAALHTPLLGEIVEEHLKSNISHQNVVEAARTAVVANGGELDGAVLKIDENRFKVNAANEFQSTSYDGFFEGIKQKLYRGSAGPRVNLIEDLWTGHSSYDL